MVRKKFMKIYTEQDIRNGELLKDMILSGEITKKEEVEDDFVFVGDDDHYYIKNWTIYIKIIVINFTNNYGR